MQVHALCNPGLRGRHWEQISSVVGFSLEPDSSFTLSRIIEMEVGNHRSELQSISEQATKEAQIESALETMRKNWQDLQLSTETWTGSNRDIDVVILNHASLEEALEKVEDDILATQLMQQQESSTAFTTELEAWRQELVALEAALTLLLSVQKLWLHLEPVFSAGDVSKQLPTEGQLFQTVDDQWRQVVAELPREPVVRDFALKDGLRQILEESTRNLEEVEKGLGDFLDTKRAVRSG